MRARRSPSKARELGSQLLARAGARDGSIQTIAQSENNKMTQITKWIGKLLFIFMSAALIAYAASRTLNFINGTLGEDDLLVGYLALFATTGGALAWLSVFLWHSEGVAQKGIALLMIALDVTGEIVLFTIETLMQSGINGTIEALAPEDIRLTVLGMSALIGANIIFIFAYHISEPKNMKALEAHFSDWKIEKAIQKAKAEKAESIAHEIAEREAEAYAIEQKAKDRRDHTIPERTAQEMLESMKENLSLLGGKSREDLPLVAAETVKVELDTSPKASTGERIK